MEASPSLSPGPGKYSPSYSTREANRTVSIQKPVKRRKRHRTHSQSISPDPSTYSLRPSTSTGVRFGNEIRPDITQSRSPGPAGYNVPRPPSSGPGFGFGVSKRPAIFRKAVSPGPGAYDVKKTENSYHYSIQSKRTVKE